jgi:hypothetical protein
MTRDEFKAITGVEASNISLEIANCGLFQVPGMHSYCGICEHGIPRTFNCASCGRWGQRIIVLNPIEPEDDSKTIKGYDGVRA